MPSTTTTPNGRMIAVKPIVLPAPARGDDLRVRVSAPATGSDLPVIVFAHGFGGAMDAYDPLVDHWAANGFVVVQPTFLDSATLGVTPIDPRYPTIWRTRYEDVERVIDELATVLDAVPGLVERVNTERLAVAGHSWGAQTVGMLLGARVLGEDGSTGEDFTDHRVRAGVLFAATGTGEELVPFAREHFAFMRPDFAELRTPTLVVAGDHDQSQLSTRGPDWFTDVYRLSPGAEALVTVLGGEHSLGGIQAYRSTETTDENPAFVDLLRRTSTAFLRTALGVDDAAWDAARSAEAADTDTVGRIDTK